MADNRVPRRTFKRKKTMVPSPVFQGLLENLTMLLASSEHYNTITADAIAKWKLDRRFASSSNELD